MVRDPQLSFLAEWVFFFELVADIAFPLDNPFVKLLSSIIVLVQQKLDIQT